MPTLIASFVWGAVPREYIFGKVRYCCVRCCHVCRHGLLAPILALSAVPLDARVIRVDVSLRGDVLGGNTFGDTGAYERITGRVYFSVRVNNAHNQRIVDLRNAVNLKNGEVEFSSDFVAVRPKDAHLGNGSMLLEVPNRGQSRILAVGRRRRRGCGRRRGRCVAAAQWIHRREPGLAMGCAGSGALRSSAPIAKENGKTITGLLRGDLMPSEAMPEIPLGHLMQAISAELNIRLLRRRIRAMCSQ